MFGNQGGGHQGGNNKALQYRWKKILGLLWEKLCGELYTIETYIF